jgi:transposase
VYVERLDWLAKNPRYTQRFARHVGALCREMTNTAVAELERLHDSTVKDLDTIYMQKQVQEAGLLAPRAIGVDEIAIRKGHDYRVVVSDLERGRPIWVGGRGRSEADLDVFFAALGAKKSAAIELAAMDMWKPFRNSLAKNKRGRESFLDTMLAGTASYVRTIPQSVERGRPTLRWWSSDPIDRILDLLLSQQAALYR